MTRCCDDRGTTLIEVLISVVILGLVFVGALSSMGTSTLAADRHRQQADAHTVLLSAAERVKSPTEVEYVPCAGGDAYLTAARAVPMPTDPGWTPAAISITGVQYWDGTNFGPTCHDDVQDAEGDFILRLQLVTVSVTSPDGKTTESIAVVKRGST